MEITIEENDIRPKCDNCGKSVNAVIRVGEQYDYDSCTAEVCIDCLKDAVKLMELLVKE